MAQITTKEVGMVSERSIPKYVVLTFVTCGLFGIYWFISLADDIAKLREQTEPRGVFDFIIGLITCGIYLLFCYYRYPQYVLEIQEKRGAKVNDISLISVLLGIFGFGIVSMALIQNELNKLVRAQ
jgi:uncharacterized protein with PQ loop repeat